MEYGRSIFSEKYRKNGVGHLLGVLSDNLVQNFQSDFMAECSIRGAMHFAYTREDGRKSLGGQAYCGSQKHKALNDFILPVAVLHGGLAMKNALQVRMGPGGPRRSPKEIQWAESAVSIILASTLPAKRSQWPRSFTYRGQHVEKTVE